MKPDKTEYSKAGVFGQVIAEATVSACLDFLEQRIVERTKQQGVQLNRKQIRSLHPATPGYPLNTIVLKPVWGSSPGLDEYAGSPQIPETCKGPAPLRGSFQKEKTCCSNSQRYQFC